MVLQNRIFSSVFLEVALLKLKTLKLYVQDENLLRTWFKLHYYNITILL